jgi:hypothetical protein
MFALISSSPSSVAALFGEANPVLAERRGLYYTICRKRKNALFCIILTKMKPKPENDKERG